MKGAALQSIELTGRLQVVFHKAAVLRSAWRICELPMTHNAPCFHAGRPAWET